jgi:tetratricopeptide (TPR) repeat protein
MAQTTDYDRGAALVEKGEFEKAIPLLSRAAEARPQDARAWKALGVAYAAQGLYGEAEPRFRRACELAPKLEDACYYAGHALYLLDRYDTALSTLEAAANLDPKSWKIRLGIAQALEAQGKAAQAGQSYQGALSLCANRDPAPGAGYGRFLVRQGRLKEAIPALETVLSRFPNAPEALTQLGRALLEDGQTAAAIPRLESATALAPRSAQAHLLLAKAYVKAGRVAEAQPHFEAAAKYESAGQQ